MTLFDPIKMKDVAWKRFEKRIRRGANEDHARADWVRESLAVDGLVKVESWLRKRGITLHFERHIGAIFNNTTQQVTVSKTLTLQSALIYVLHECGHILIGNEGASRRYELGYPKQNDPRFNHTFQHRLAILEEEIEAWYRGKKLIERLEIHWCVSEPLWEKKKQECIRSYLRWSLNPKDFADS